MGSKVGTVWVAVVGLLVFLSIVSVSSALSCFECSSVNDTYCPDSMNHDDEQIVELRECHGYLYEGAYCVKTTGVTGGFSSSSDLYCFVCDDTVDLGCSNSNFLYGKLTSCRNVFDAQFCIKAEGVWAGSLGTRRFCSSRDLGTYCDFLKRPGDQLEYRSCVYTCTGDGCNGSERNNGFNLFLMVISVLIPWNLIL